MWLPLPKFEELYEISITGGIRNKLTGKHLSVIKKGNYLVCYLKVNNKTTCINVSKTVVHLFGSDVLPNESGRVKQYKYLYSSTNRDKLINSVFM